jgi:hypothetical protein
MHHSNPAVAAGAVIFSTPLLLGSAFEALLSIITNVTRFDFSDSDS